MANLKNIVDLPVAESAEGVNLIIEDNGVAKKIAAGTAGLGGSGGASDGVQYVEQTLTEEQKMQARKNMGLYYNDETLIDEIELTFSNGSASGVVENLEDGATIKIVMSGDSITGQYELIGLVQYQGNPVYDYMFTVNGGPNNYFSIDYMFGNWNNCGIQNLPDGTYQVTVYKVITEQISEEYIPDTIARKNETLIITERPQVLTAQTADEVMGRFNELLTALNNLGIIEKNSAPL